MNPGLRRDARPVIVCQSVLGTVLAACPLRAQRPPRERVLCAGHARQLGGESPLPNVMEVKGCEAQGCRREAGLKEA